MKIAILMLVMVAPVAVSAQDSCTAWLTYRVSEGTLPPGLSLHPVTGVISGTPSAGGSFTFTIEASSGCEPALREYTMNVAIAPPANFTATAQSTSAVALSWNAVPGATGYEVHRSEANGPFHLQITTTAISAADTGLAANTTYLYKVRGTFGGGTPSLFSAVNAATTVIFGDDPLAVGSFIKASHIAQLRTAVNAFGVAGGISPQPYSDPVLNAGNLIRAVHITELRTRLDAARQAIGLTAISYLDPLISPETTVARRTHITDLRNGVK